MFLTLVTVGLTVVFHYEVLSHLNERLPHWKRISQRLRILTLIFALLFLHIAEIWLFSIGIHLSALYPSLGHIQGIVDSNFLDAVYLSATTYTTLGIGDLIPQGPIRFLIGTESVVGLMMITWSASFTYLEMQRYWKPH